jgi:predicted NBD/HSP70 family sugar kinase
MSVKTTAEPLPAAATQLPKAIGRGVNSAWVRRVNAVLLMRALRRCPGSSQRELVALTGLDKATVSAVTSQLVAAGFVARRDAPAAARRLGRPAVALDIPRSAGVVFGARLEPDRIEAVAADLGGRILDRESAPGSASAVDALLSLRSVIDRLSWRLGPLPRRAIGIGVPALIEQSGRLLFGPNLGWRDVPLAQYAAQLLPAPVIVENDTNAAAIAEREFGSCTGVDDFIYVSGHSGVGGAIFAGGELYRGASGLAGEIGHIKVVAGGRACACGGFGCLEAYASEPALLAVLAERGHPAASLAEVAARAAAGDAVARNLLAETGVLLGRALAALVNALNPAQVVLGGQLAVVAPWVLATLRAELAAAALAELAAGVRVECSPLGADAVLIGGISLALRRVDADLVDPIAANTV